MVTGGPGALAQSVKKPQEPEAPNGHPFDAEVKNLDDTYFTPQYAFMAWYLTAQGLHLTFNRSGYLALNFLE